MNIGRERTRTAWLGGRLPAAPARRLLIAAACGALPCCTRPSEDRARQNQEVGRAEVEALGVDVAAGLAVVQTLEPDFISLWASAPRLELTLSFHAPAPEALWLEVENCIAGTVLDAGETPVVDGGREGKTCRFQIGPIEATERLGLRLAPPGSELAGALRFAVMSDVQEAIDRVQDIYAVVNREPGLDFMLSAGDLTEFGTGSELERFQAELLGLDIPFYATLGNHELRVARSLFQDYFGRGSLSFEYRGARFTLLDSASATIDPIVMGWLDEWLALGLDRLHVAAMHVPPRDPIGMRDVAFASRNEASQLLARLAAGGVDLTLYGHVHSYYRFENAGIPAYISGGGGSHPERFDGIGRHFLVVEADPAAGTVAVRVVRVD